MPESAKRGLPTDSGAEILRRLAAVRRTARKAEDPDMRRLWLRHAIYFYQEYKKCTS